MAPAIYPGHASGVGRAWGISTIALAIVFVVVAEHQLLVRRRTDHEASGHGAGVAAESILDETWAA